MIISITGRSGSGKTTVVNNLISIFGQDSISYLHQDSYYKDQSHVPYEKRKFINFDHPASLDIDLFTNHLIKLSEGTIINKPIYDYKTHTREKNTEEVRPLKIILIDGIHVFSTERLRKLSDIKVFLNVSKDICFIRRLLRDTKERERSMESVINQYIETVRPMQEKYISPMIRYADFIIESGGKNIIEIEKLASAVRKILKKSI
jgi:uridine kinase